MIINAADLFCGAGGTSTGLLDAAKALGKRVRLVAVNHWELAIATHVINHPDAQHYNSDLGIVDPRQAVPGGKLRLLVASPECTHFSRARGGKPMSKQSRASVKYVLRWVRALDVDDLLVENVPDFLTWGPLDPETMRPVKSRRGEYFHRFVRSLERLGYTVDWRVLNAADYGDPQTRKRLFVLARKGRPIVWPEQTHHRNGGDMFGAMPKWRAAREIIDWTNKGESIFTRKKPLKPNTMRKIWSRLRKFGLRQCDWHPNTSHDNIQSVDVPQTITAQQSSDMAVVQPYILQIDNGGVLHDIDKPMATITSFDSWGLVEPYLVEYYGTGESYSVDEPLKTITGRDRFGLVWPMWMYHGGKHYLFDILFRMLTPHELARGMSFPDSYQFVGNREQVVKQIGNSVPRRLAKALITRLLED